MAKERRPVADILADSRVVLGEFENLVQKLDRQFAELEQVVEIQRTELAEKRGRR